MEQFAAKGSRRAGWSDAEASLLWETADEAQAQGVPLKAVFERIAESTGRRPNSIRNFYYAQARQHNSPGNATARFVPFTEQEVEWLITQVLRDRAQGSSVRACLKRISGGDHSLMLRYQNKYRAVIKSRPDYVNGLVEKLRAEGVECTTPEVNRRARVTAQSAVGLMNESAYRSGDAEIVRACETLSAMIDAMRSGERFASPALVEAVKSFIRPVKDFVSLQPEARHAELDSFASEMASLIGSLEESLPAGSV